MRWLSISCLPCPSKYQSVVSRFTIMLKTHCDLAADSCRGTGLNLRLADCQPPSWRVWSRLRLLILLPWLIFTACSDSDGSDALIVAGLDGQEPELVDYLDSLRQAVRGQPDSGSSHRLDALRSLASPPVGHDCRTSRTASVAASEHHADACEDFHHANGLPTHAGRSSRD